MSEELRANLEQVIDKWGLTGNKSQIRRNKSEAIPLRKPRTVPVARKRVIAARQPMKSIAHLKTPRYYRGFPPWQWLLRGLMEDRLVPIVVLAAILYSAISLCAVTVYLVGTIL